EALEAPAFGEPFGDQSVDFGPAGVSPDDDVIKEVALCRVIDLILDRRPEPVIVEFLEQSRQRRAFHFLLVERLDGGKPGGGTRTGTRLGHQPSALAAASPARKGPSAAAT